MHAMDACYGCVGTIDGFPNIDASLTRAVNEVAVRGRCAQLLHISGNSQIVSKLSYSTSS